VLLHLDCHFTNLSASLEISLSHQAVYYYLLDNPVSRPSFVPTVIAAFHPSNMLNLENEGRMQDKEIERNALAHRWCLIHATMPIVFMSEMVLSHLFSMVESCSSSLLLIHRQIVSRENSTRLGHINILLDLSSTRDYRMLLCMIGMIEKILDLWNTNSFFSLLMYRVLGL